MLLAAGALCRKQSGISQLMALVLHPSSQSELTDVIFPDDGIKISSAI